MMQLTITELAQQALAVEFEHQGKISRYQVEDFDGVMTAGLQSELNDYASVQLVALESPATGHLLQRLEQAGRSLGDQLAGDDHELASIADIIEQLDEPLTVRIVGDSSWFLRQPWEYLIPFGSQFWLSSRAGRVLRCLSEVPLDNTVAAEINVSEQPSMLQLLDAQYSHDTNIMAISQQALTLGIRCRSCILDADQPVVPDNARGSWIALLAANIDTSADQQLYIGTRERALEPVLRALADSGIRCLILHDALPIPRLQQVLSLAARVGIADVLVPGRNQHPAVMAAALGSLMPILRQGGELANAIGQWRRQQWQSPTPLSFGLSPRHGVLAGAICHYQLAASDAWPASEPSDAVDYSVLQRLHGFQSAMLPPLHVAAIDPQRGSWMLQSEQLWLSGHAGSGKTQLAHWLALQWLLDDVAEQAFYFDASQALTESMVVGMLQGALGLKVEEDRSALQQALHDATVVWVIDQLPENPVSRLDWLAALKQLGGDHQRWLLISHHGVVPDNLEAIGLTPRHHHISGLTDAEVLSLLSRLGDPAAAAPGSGAEPFDPEHEAKALTSFVDHCERRPWLIERLLPAWLAARNQPEGCSHLLTRAAKLAAAESLRDAFVADQLADLSAPAKQLLGLVLPVRGLLLDMLQMLEQPGMESDRQALMGASDIPVRSIIHEWLAAGLLVSYPHGRLLDESLLTALQRQLPEPAAEKRLCFAAVLARLLPRVCAHLQQQANPSITNNLILNRRSWAAQLELLWKAGRYHQVAPALSALESLLKQVRVTGETREWLLAMLQEQPLPDLSANRLQESSQALTAWLRMAADCLTGQPDLQQRLLATAKQWQDWLLQVADTAVPADLPVLTALAGLLVRLHMEAGHWQQACQLLESLLPIWHQRDAMGNLIEHGLLLIRCCYRVGDTQRAQQLKQQLLNDIDYSDAPDGTELRVLQRILQTLLDEGESEAVERLCEQHPLLSTLDWQQEPWAALANRRQWLQGDYQAALPYVLDKWQRASTSGLAEVAAMLASQIQAAATAMDKADFDEVCLQHLPEGMSFQWQVN